MSTDRNPWVTVIQNIDGLRVGNLIFVDSIVMPANFICAKPTVLTDRFEEVFEGMSELERLGVAYLNADKRNVIQLLKEERDGKLWNGEFSAELIDNTTDDKTTQWRIQYHDKKAVISFIHELQNYYFDWTGNNLINLLNSNND